MSERIYIEDRMDAAEHRLAKLEARVNDAVDAAPPKVTLPDLREAINSGRVNVSPVVPNMVEKWDRPDAAPALDDWPGHGIHVSRDAKTGQVMIAFPRNPCVVQWNVEKNEVWLGRVMSPGNADAPALDDRALRALCKGMMHIYMLVPGLCPEQIAKNGLDPIFLSSWSDDYIAPMLPILRDFLAREARRG